MATIDWTEDDYIRQADANRAYDVAVAGGQSPPPPTITPNPALAPPPPAPRPPTFTTPPATDFGGGPRGDPVSDAQRRRQIADAMRARAPLGYEPRKWANPNLDASHKYVGGRILAAGGSIANILEDPKFAGWTQIANDKIRSPQGNVYDVWFDEDNATGRRRVQWTRIRTPEQRLADEPADAARRAAAAERAAAANRLAQTGRAGAGGPGAGPGSGGPGPADPGTFRSSYTAQFDDPSTRQYEDLLQHQMGALEAQRGVQGQANVGLRGQQTEAQAATDRLLAFLGQRAGELRQPAYTGAEQEILRTQMLEPIERDRQAAQKRALEYNVGGRGFEPTSGIAIQLLNDIDAGYDRQRAEAQGDLAYRQVGERRSREQEAQSLLGLIPQLRRGAAGADLQFGEDLNASVNRPRDQMLGLSQMLYRLPASAQADALAAMGMGPGADQLMQQAWQMYQAQLGQQQQGLGYYQMLGSLLPYLLPQRA